MRISADAPSMSTFYTATRALAARRTPSSPAAPPAVPTRAWLVSQVESLEAVLGHASPRELAEIFREFTGGSITMRAIILTCPRVMYQS